MEASNQNLKASRLRTFAIGSPVKISICSRTQILHQGADPITFGEGVGRF